MGTPVTPARLRVLHVVNRLSHESVPVDLAGALTKRGIEIGVAAYYPVPDPPPGCPELTIFGLDARRGPAPAVLGRLRRVVRAFSPDVVHVHHTASALATSAALGGSALPVVKTVHSSHRARSRSQAIADAATLARSTAVACNSQATINSFRSWEVRLFGRKTTVIHNGVDSDRVERGVERRSRARRELGLEGVTVVGCVARLVAAKNHRALIQALRTLRDHVPGVHLLLVGDGPLRSELGELVRSLGLTNCVTFLGSVDRARAYEALGAMDLCALPSLHEGFCNAAVEALAAGKPVVASDIPALREVLGQHALYVDPLAPTEIAAGLLALLDARDTCVPGPASSRRYVRDHLSLDKSAATYHALYLRTLGRHASA